MKAPLRRFGRIPAVAITGYASLDDRVHALAAGFQGHIGKPIDPMEVVAEIKRVIQDVSSRL